jgi:hypothetical protein
MVRNIVMNKIPYLINEMPQDALKRPSRMDGIFVTTVDEVGCPYVVIIFGDEPIKEVYDPK